MPSWPIHLTIAKIVTEKFNFGKDVDLFYYGNLLPDVDKGTIISRYQAHYYGDLKWDGCLRENKIEIERFLKDYKLLMDNSLVIGYYAHLLTDNYYNNIVYSKCWVQNKNNDIIGIRLRNNRVKKIDIGDRKRLKRKYKHFDFELYGKHLFKKDLVISFDDKKILVGSRCLKPNFLDEQLVCRRIKYLKNDFIKNNRFTFLERINKYKLFTKKELDEMLISCSSYVIDKIKELGIKEWN